MNGISYPPPPGLGPSPCAPDDPYPGTMGLGAECTKPTSSMGRYPASLNRVGAAETAEMSVVGATQALASAGAVYAEQTNSVLLMMQERIAGLERLVADLQRRVG